MDSQPSETVLASGNSHTQPPTSSTEPENCLPTPEGVAHDNDQSRDHNCCAECPDHPSGHEVQAGPELPKPTTAGRQPYVKQFSVQSRRHSFVVTDYGPESVDKSLESVFSGTQHAPVAAVPEESSGESGVQVTPSTSCVVDMSQLDGVDGAAVGRSSPSTAFTVSGTIPSLSEKPKTRKQLLAFEIAKRGRLFAKRKRDRLVEKNGECRIVYTKVSDRSYRLLHDFFTTMLELKWRYHFVLFGLVFVASWLAFGLVWWGLAVYDLGRPSGPTTNDSSVGVGVEPCIVGVDDYVGALLFSIETQQTIGYGTRALTTRCPLAVGVVMLQSMYGVVVQCLLTGIIFAKLARPKRRAQTILFSEKAVVCERDGRRALVFRVADIRRSQVLGASVHVLLTERRTTREGECLPIAARELAVTTDSGGRFFFLAWPIEVLHRIDERSPLWELSETDLIQQDWEFIVVLEGVAEATGAAFQVRTSYLPSEVLWGHRLRSLLNRSSGGLLEIDYSYFHETEPVSMTEQSAKAAADEQRRPGNENDNNNERPRNEPHKQETRSVSFKS